MITYFSHVPALDDMKWGWWWWCWWWEWRQDWMFCASNDLLPASPWLKMPPWCSSISRKTWVQLPCFAKQFISLAANGVWVGRMPSIPSQLNQQCNQLLYSSQKLLGEVPLPFCFALVLGGHLQSCETYDFTTPEALTGSLNQPFSSLKPPWYPHRFPIPWNFHQYPTKFH